MMSASRSRSRPCCRYLGSADAVRKNIGELKDEARGITPARDYVILSGAGDPSTGFCDFYCGSGWLAHCTGLDPVAPAEGGWHAARRNALQLGTMLHAPALSALSAAVYDMDFQQMVAFHRAKNADVTIAMHTVSCWWYGGGGGGGGLHF